MQGNNHELESGAAVNDTHQHAFRAADAMGRTDNSSRVCRSSRLMSIPWRLAGTAFLSRFSRIRQRPGARAAAMVLLASLALIAPSALAQDTTPTISSVTINSTPSFDADGDNTADTYIRGDKIVVDVRFSEAVSVSGGNSSVRLRLDIGADDTNLGNSRSVLMLKSVVGGNTLRFEHTVQRWDSDPDGVWVQTGSATNTRTVFTVGGATVTSTATGVGALLTTSGLRTSGAANHKVDGSRTQATAAANRPPAFPEGVSDTLYIVRENNAAGALVATAAATDPDGDALTYSLDSASDAIFDIDSSANITVTAANVLDHETKDRYTITVSVHDGKNAAGAADTTVDATRRVKVVVGDTEEQPVFPTNAPTTLEVAENNAAGAPVGRVSATDSDGDALTYALDSASDAVFDIDANGNITVTAANGLDYETKASYAVTVSVNDGKNGAREPDTTVDATHSLTIAVTDVQEPTSVPPTIASVTISSTPTFDADGDSTADTYIRGDKIVVDVRFSEAVSVSGGNNSIRLRLDIGADDTNLANSRSVLMLKSVVGGNTLRFEHTVQRWHADPDGVWVQTGSATDSQTVFTVGGAVTSTATGAAAVLTKSGLPTSGAATHRVDGSRTQAPSAANGAPSFTANAPTTLEVAENNAAGVTVGTVSATDPDGDALTYALDSASDAVFDIDSSGNITVTAANALDYETKVSYAVTVSVHDGKDALGQPDTAVDATLNVTIRVTDVEETTNDPPSIASVAISSTPSFDADGDSTADTYIRGDKIVVDVRFSEAVSVSGGNNSIRLRLDIGADDTNLANSRSVLMLKSVVGGNTLRFEHTVQRWHADPDGVWVQTGSATDSQTVFTVGGAVTSTATGVAAILTKSGLPTSGAATHKVDGSRTQAANPPPQALPARLESAATEEAGGGLTLTFTKDISVAGSRTAYTVLVDGASREIDRAFWQDNTVSLALAEAVRWGETVTVAYAKPASGTTLQDIDELAIESFGPVSVTNTVPQPPAANRPPTFPAGTPVRWGIAENNEAGQPVADVRATDPDGDVLTYALDSSSDAVFDIDSNGRITVTAANAFDYETKASYAVTVSVHDGKDGAGQPDTAVDVTLSITISVVPPLAPAEPVRVFDIDSSMRTSIVFRWRLPRQPEGVTVSAVEVQSLPGSMPPWITVASLAPVADGERMSHKVIALTPGEEYHFRIRLVTNRGNADSKSRFFFKGADLEPVTDLSVSNVTRTTVDLAWKMMPAGPADPHPWTLDVQQRGANGDWTTVSSIASPDYA